MLRGPLCTTECGLGGFLDSSRGRNIQLSRYNIGEPTNFFITSLHQCLCLQYNSMPPSKCRRSIDIWPQTLSVFRVWWVAWCTSVIHHFKGCFVDCASTLSSIFMYNFLEYRQVHITYTPISFQFCRLDFYNCKSQPKSKSARSNTDRALSLYNIELEQQCLLAFV